MLPDDGRHGSVAGYGAGCRHACCKKAVSDYENRRRLDQMANRQRLIPRTGAVRRLRALQALGWPSPVLSARLGRSRNYVSAFTTRTDNETMRVDVYEEIVNLYDELCMTIGPSSLTAARSAAAGWQPPLAWDDIDGDPIVTSKYIANDYCPDTFLDEVLVARVLGGDMSCARSATPAERTQVAQRWAGSLADLERQTGWNVHRDLRRSAA